MNEDRLKWNQRERCIPDNAPGSNRCRAKARRSAKRTGNRIARRVKLKGALDE